MSEDRQQMEHVPRGVKSSRIGVPTPPFNIGESNVGLGVLPQPETIAQKLGHRIRVFEKTADIINKLPFVGKLAITPIAHNAFAERNPMYKSVKVAEATGLLGVMAALHGYQVQLGMDAFQRNAERLSNDQSPEALLTCMVDVAYTAANYAVVYGQVYLTGRLGKHYVKEMSKLRPKLEAWGIQKDQINYQQVAEHLLTAVRDNDQGSIDTFFMLLPKKEKEKVMKELRQIKGIVNDTYSYEEVDQKIGELNNDVKDKSRLRYTASIIANAHRENRFGKGYSVKETLSALVVTLGGQVAFFRTWL